MDAGDFVLSGDENLDRFTGALTQGLRSLDCAARGKWPGGLAPFTFGRSPVDLGLLTSGAGFHAVQGLVQALEALPCCLHLSTCPIDVVRYLLPQDFLCGCAESPRALVESPLALIGPGPGFLGLYLALVG
jgi:hypothetical protein